jgi:hypothetical protein
MFYKAAQTVRLGKDEDGNRMREDLGIYHHFTVAIDTDNIKKVFEAVKDMDLGIFIFFIIF